MPMQPLLHYVCYAADGIMTLGENVSMYYRGKGLRCGGGGEYHGVQQPSPYSQKCPPQSTSVLRGHWESQPQGYEGFFDRPMYVCMYVHMYVCMYVCMYACMFVCMYVCIYVYVPTYGQEKTYVCI